MSLWTQNTFDEDLNVPRTSNILKPDLAYCSFCHFDISKYQGKSKNEFKEIVTHMKWKKMARTGSGINFRALNCENWSRQHLSS